MVFKYVGENNRVKAGVAGGERWGWGGDYYSPDDQGRPPRPRREVM